jgi:hypothetical protein
VRVTPRTFPETCSYQPPAVPYGVQEGRQTSEEIRLRESGNIPSQSGKPITERSTPQLQLDNSPPRYDDEVYSAPKFDSHNQPIPPSLQLKRYGSSQRYNSRQNQLVQDLSVRLIAVVLPKQCPPPPRPKPRRILNEDIRVRKLRGDKHDLSYCLPKTQFTPRPPR